MIQQKNFRKQNGRYLRRVVLIIIISLALLALTLTAFGQDTQPTSPPVNEPTISQANNAWGNPLPDEIGYQGQLVDNNGLPQVGSYTIEFAVLSGPPNYTLRYTETQTVSTDQEGLFNVMVGAVQPGLGDALIDGNAWLEVKLDNEILAPRQPVGSVAYALYAQNLVGGSGEYSVLAGGQTNDASGNWSVSTGGLRNIVGGTASFVGGGRDNIASGTYSVVAAGVSNEAAGSDSTISGGSYNVASAQHATVGGGNQNEATNLWSVVSGGGLNGANGRYSTIGGGLSNTATYTYTTVSGGYNNSAIDYAAAVSGGSNNNANGSHSTIGGGSENITHHSGSTISGGYSNTTNWTNTTVGGGAHNSATLDGATVGGGENNSAAGFNATVSGGYGNEAGGNSAAIGGGVGNTANGLHATIPGGSSNTAAGDDSFAAGTQAYANHEGTFVWSDSSFRAQDFQSTAAHQFLIDAEGGMGINTNTPQSQLHIVDSQNGAATNVSAHVATIENDSSGTSPDVLALQVSNATDPDGTANYVTFFDANGAIAAIEGNGSGGVTYSTSGADFAEYLPLHHADEALQPGDVVGLIAGGVGLQTAVSNRVLVVSSAAGFVGNASEAEGRDDMMLVAFMGQVPVRVRGSVQAGDLLVASGLEDGTAVAISAHQLSPAQANQIVGQALESNDGSGESLVNTLVGLPNDGLWAARLSETQAQFDDLAARLTALEAEADHE